MSDEKTSAPVSGDRQAELLSQALPYMQAYAGRSVVIKFGGNAMVDEALGRAFARDVALLRQSGAEPVVIHGGGPQIGAMLDRLGVQSRFEGGMRVTDRATVEVVEMVLAGSINKGLVSDFNAEGARAIGLCGKDGNMVRAVKMARTVRDPDSAIERVVDLGFVGEPDAVDTTVLDMVASARLIPVVAPVAFGHDGETYNVNADTFAGAVAGAMKADRLLFLTDVAGVLDKEGQVLPRLTVAEARALMADGTISGGMTPKVETCIAAIEGGVEAVVIVDGRVPHCVLLELFTPHGAGTMFVRDDTVEAGL